ncbi:MAG: hypothetical protein RQ752_10965, partial [Thermohalobaculum sp.]|nr:hypothetical protein [Thermohalobaculum sp.]
MDTSTPSATAPADAAATPMRPAAFVCFSYGMTKCGSTLAFEMARTILEQAGCPQPRLDGSVVADWSNINFAEDLSPARVTALGQAVAAVGHPIVVKLHGTCTPAARTLVRDGLARAHAVYRDP